MSALRFPALLFLLLAVAFPSYAKVAPTPLENLYWGSEIVAIGRDVRTFEKDGWQLAEFEILRVIKGACSARDRVFYLAESTWTCDVSHARPGRQALLFLHSVPEKYHPSKRDPSPVIRRLPPYETGGGQTVYRITAWGNGRMELEDSNRVSIFTAVVVLPNTLVEQSVPADEYPVTSSLPLDSIESYLRSLPERPPTPTAKTGPLPPSMLRP